MMKLISVLRNNILRDTINLSTNIEKKGRDKRRIDSREQREKELLLSFQDGKSSKRRNAVVYSSVDVSTRYQTNTLMSTG